MIDSHDIAWAKLVLGGVTSPGLCKIPDAPDAEKWDVQSAKGKVGATTIRNGADPRKFTCIFSLIDGPGSTDMAEWETFQALIQSTVAGDTPIALPVYHPALSMSKIGDVCKDSIGLLIPDGKGGFSVTCAFIENKPPKPKGSKAAKPGDQYYQAGKTPGSGNSAIDKARSTLDALTAQAAAKP